MFFAICNSTSQLKLPPQKLSMTQSPFRLLLTSFTPWGSVNITSEILMPSVNRAAKESLRGLGSNITDNAVKRVGKSIGEIIKIINHFDKDNNIKKLSRRHSKRTKKKDMDAIVKQ